MLTWGVLLPGAVSAASRGDGARHGSRRDDRQRGGRAGLRCDGHRLVATGALPTSGVRPFRVVLLLATTHVKLYRAISAPCRGADL